MQGVNLVGITRDLILFLHILPMWCSIHAIIFSIWKDIVLCPIIQLKIDKSSKKKGPSRKPVKEEKKQPKTCGERRSNNSSSSEEHPLLKSMIISYIFIEDFKVHERCITIGGAYGSDVKVL